MADAEKHKGCIFVFSECGFKGRSLGSCQKAPTTLSQFPFEVKSVFLSEGSSMTFFMEDEQRALSFTDSVDCLKQGMNFAFTIGYLRLSFQNGAVFED